MKPGGNSRARRAFTLLEIMLVVGIIGLVVAASVPSLYQLLHREGFRKTVADIQDICKKARANAILQGTTTSVEFHPLEGRCNLGETVVAFGQTATLEMLDVNLRECKDLDQVRVSFFPAGTSDEMTIFLRSFDNERRRISLEITTGLPVVEVVE